MTHLLLFFCRKRSRAYKKCKHGRGTVASSSMGMRHLQEAEGNMNEQAKTQIKHSNEEPRPAR